MLERRRKYSPEYRDEIVKMVIETSRPIAAVARELYINAELGREVPDRPPLTLSDRARLHDW